jgi:hypothetical protein
LRCWSTSKAEPAGVGGQGGEDGGGDVGSDFDAEVSGGLEDEPSRGFGRRVFEPSGAEIVAADVMVHDCHVALEGANHIPHVAQLGPGGGIEDEQQVCGVHVLLGTLLKCWRTPSGSMNCRLGGTSKGLPS